MKSKYTGWVTQRPAAGHEEDALNGSGPRAKNASDNRCSDRFQRECPGTHATTTTRPRAAEAGRSRTATPDFRPTPEAAEARETTPGRDRANHDVGPEKRLRHEEEPTETRAPSTPTTASRTRERDATEHDVTEAGAQRPRKDDRSDRRQHPKHRRHAGDRREEPTKAGAGVATPTSTTRGLLANAAHRLARNRRRPRLLEWRCSRRGRRNTPRTAAERARHTQDFADTAHDLREELTRCQEQQPRHSALST